MNRIRFSFLGLAPLFFISALSTPAGSIYEIKTGSATGVQTISGVVSLVEPSMCFFLADDAGPYRGIYVDQTTYGPDIGDQVTATGMVTNVSGRIQLQNITAFSVQSKNNEVHAPIPVTAAELLDDLGARCDNSYEGSLVKLTNPPNPLTVANQNAGGGTWQANDGTGVITINAALDYNYFPKNGDQFQAIAGIIKKSGTNAFQLQPRFTADLRAGPNILPNYALKGTVVTMDDARNIFNNYYLVVRNDDITDVTPSAPPGLTIINVDGLIFPGLVSTHDHLDYGLWDFIPFSVPPYFRERNDWANGVYGDSLNHDFKSQRRGFSGMFDQIAKLVEVRMATSGCTVTQSRGSGIISKLGVGIIHGERFPGRVHNAVFADKRQDWAVRHLEATRGTLHRYMVHLGESTDDGPTMADQWNWWKTQPAFDGYDTIIHGINIPAADFASFNHGTDAFGRPLRTMLSWAPKSNMLLYNATADIPAALAAGVIVAIGPDWSESGMPNMLAELNYARSVANAKGWNIQTRQFIEMVTRNAAEAFGQLWRFGTLEPGKMANLMVIKDGIGDPYDDLMMVAGGGYDPGYRGGPKDVRLTIVAGRPIYGDADLLNTTNFPFLDASRIENLTICGVPKKLKYARHNPGSFSGADELFNDFYLELWLKYLRSSRYPCDFLPVDPCGVFPPTPAPTPTPPHGAYSIAASTDDTHQHSQHYADNTSYIWVGRQNVSEGYNAGFRFNNIRVPPGQDIRQAKLVLTQYTGYDTKTPLVRIAAHNVDDSPTYTDSNGPLNRPLTNERVKWTMPAAGNDQEIISPDIKNVIQEIVNRPGWKAGNSISIILEADEPRIDNRRRVWAYDGDPGKSAKLIIETGSAPTPTSAPAFGSP